MRVIFITDLDGTLLGQNDFCFDQIKDAILEFLAKEIKIIPASSKTQLEIENFCRALGVDLPFICENGAKLVNSHLLTRKTGVVDLKNSILGCDKERLLAIWSATISSKTKNKCVFLDSLNKAKQAAILGLQGTYLARAMDRSYSALFTFHGTRTDFGALQQEVLEAGLMVQLGGRVCALSAPHDKASFHSLIRQMMAGESDQTVLVGFGDSQNDLSMLQDSDVACVIPRLGCRHLTIPEPPKMLVKAQAVAPQGWLEAAKKALRMIEDKHGESNG